MNQPADYDAESILSDELLTEIFDEQEPITQARTLLSFQERAAILDKETPGTLKKFNTLVRAYKKAIKESGRPSQQQQSCVDNMTQFDYFDDGHELYCGTWIADESGVRTFNMFGEVLACYHPILPVERFVNAETGKEKIRIAFKKGFKWNEITVDKGVIASANKIVSLADYGVSVTSETAKYLVRYLSDIENYNVEKIEMRTSTSKLGWINDEFMPYGFNVVFDADNRFKTCFESVREYGDLSEWMTLVKRIRAAGRKEPQLYIAGALSSILIEPLNALPFIINLWGDSGKGKTVNIMLACSVWADPTENKYITDPKTTANALEFRMDFLNSMPMLIDDMAQIKDKYSDDFSELIYMLCSGKGKDRANRDLGINRASTWRNVILTNGEHSLITETMQGGAINRVIDMEMGDGYIFPDGNSVVETISKNYGFLGKEFLSVIQTIGIDSVREIQQKFLDRIREKEKVLGVEKEEKQTLPMSILLAADQIATEYIFQDGIYMDFDYYFGLLKDKGEVSENERAYDFIMGEVAINIQKFKPQNNGEYKNEVWGDISGGYVNILTNVFNRMCKEGNFNSRSFLSWADKNMILEHGKGRNTKLMRLNGSNSPSRVVSLRIINENDDDDGFLPLDDSGQEDLPFD